MTASPRFPMRLLVAFVAFGALADATALAHPPPPRVYIRVTKNGNCYIAGKGIACAALGAKVAEMHINPPDLIEVMGGPVLVVNEVVNSLTKSGYSNVLAFYEK